MEKNKWEQELRQEGSTRNKKKVLRGKTSYEQIPIQSSSTKGSNIGWYKDSKYEIARKIGRHENQERWKEFRNSLPSDLKERYSTCPSNRSVKSMDIGPSMLSTDLLNSTSSINNTSSSHARIPELCAEDKEKLAKLIQQLVKVSSDHDKACEDIEKERKENSERIQKLKNQNEEMVKETAELRAKFGNSLQLLRDYQEKLVELQRDKDKEYHEYKKSSKELDILKEKILILEKKLTKQQIDKERKERELRKDYEKQICSLEDQLRQTNELLMIERQKTIHSEKLAELAKSKSENETQREIPLVIEEEKVEKEKEEIQDKNVKHHENIPVHLPNKNHRNRINENTQKELKNNSLDAKVKGMVEAWKDKLEEAIMNSCEMAVKSIAKNTFLQNSIEYEKDQHQIQHNSNSITQNMETFSYPRHASIEQILHTPPKVQRSSFDDLLINQNTNHSPVSQLSRSLPPSNIQNQSESVHNYKPKTMENACNSSSQFVSNGQATSYYERKNLSLLQDHTHTLSHSYVENMNKYPNPSIGTKFSSNADIEYLHDAVADSDFHNTSLFDIISTMDEPEEFKHENESLMDLSKKKKNTLSNSKRISQPKTIYTKRLSNVDEVISMIDRNNLSSGIQSNQSIDFYSTRSLLYEQSRRRNSKSREFTSDSLGSTHDSSPIQLHDDIEEVAYVLNNNAYFSNEDQESTTQSEKVNPVEFMMNVEHEADLDP